MTLTYTVKTGGGGDYTSLAAWLAGEQANIGTDDIIVDCSGGADTSYFDMGGTSNDAATRLTIRADPAEPDGLNTGNEFSFSHYHSDRNGTGWRMRGAKYVTIENLQFQHTVTNYTLRIQHGGGPNGIKILGCRFRHTVGGSCIFSNDTDPIEELSACTFEGVVGTNAAVLNTGVITDVLNNTFKGWNISWSPMLTYVPVNFFNCQFIDNIEDSDRDNPTNAGNNATSKSTPDAGRGITITDIVAGTDYVSATDFRAKSGGKLADPAGDGNNLPAKDITGATFANANVSPFNEIEGAGPAPSGGYSFGYVIS